MITARWLSLGLLGVAAVAGAGVLLQWQTNAVLREELGRLQEEQRRLAAVRAEHERLASGRVTEAELQRLRSDHAALARLRAEVGDLNQRVATRQRAAEKSLPSPRAPVVNPPPALALSLGIGADGALLVDGSPAEMTSIEQRLAALLRGARVEVRLAVAPAQLEKASQTTRRLMGLAKERGLRMEVKYDRPTR